MDTQKILDMIAKNPAAAGVLGGLAGSLLGGALTGGKSRGGSLLKTGGMAAVGYLAYQAWQRHQAKQAGTAVPAAAQPGALAQLPATIPSAFDLTQANNTSAAMRVVQAMVAAAKADGEVDVGERDKIVRRVGQAELSQQERDAVTKLLSQPMDMDAVVSGATTPELAAEIYAASLLAVHPASRVERAYLDMLAARLNLDAGLVTELESGVMAAVTVHA